MVEAAAEQLISAAAGEVTAVMFDAGRDAYWVSGIRHSEVLSPGPLGTGTKVRHDGGFLWKKFSWVTEVERFETGRLLAMRFLSGPFSGHVTYAVARSGDGSLASIRIVGAAKFSMPFMAAMMRRSIRADLRRLKALVEGQVTPAG